MMASRTARRCASSTGTAGSAEAGGASSSSAETESAIPASGSTAAASLGSSSCILSGVVFLYRDNGLFGGKYSFEILVALQGDLAEEVLLRHYDRLQFDHFQGSEKESDHGPAAALLFEDPQDEHGLLWADFQKTLFQVEN